MAKALKAKHLSKDDLTSSYSAEQGKERQVGKSMPPHLSKHGTRTTRAARKVEPAPKVAPNKPEKSTVALNKRRQALRAKVKGGTATPAERTELNRIIAQLKKQAK